MKAQYTIDLGEQQSTVNVEANGDRFTVELDGDTVELDAQQVGPGEFHLINGNRSHNVLLEGHGPDTVVHLDGVAIPVRLLDERQAARLAATGGSGPSRNADGTVAIQAPMPGKVVKCLAAVGAEVSEGQGVIVVEAMKMENELHAPIDGKIKEVLVVEGTNVEAGENLVLIE